MLIVTVLIRREIRLAELPRVIRHAMVLVGGILVILGFSLALTNWLIDAEVPDTLFQFRRRQFGKAFGQVDPHHFAGTVRQLPHQPADGGADRLHGAPRKQGKEAQETDDQRAFQLIHRHLQ